MLSKLQNVGYFVLAHRVMNLRVPKLCLNCCSSPRYHLTQFAWFKFEPGINLFESAIKQSSYIKQNEWENIVCNDCPFYLGLNVIKDNTHRQTWLIIDVSTYPTQLSCLSQVSIYTPHQGELLMSSTGNMLTGIYPQRADLLSEWGFPSMSIILQASS